MSAYTTDEIRAYLVANNLVDGALQPRDPMAIYEAALAQGVTTGELAEALNRPADAIAQWVADSGLAALNGQTVVYAESGAIGKTVAPGDVVVTEVGTGGPVLRTDANGTYQILPDGTVQYLTKSGGTIVGMGSEVPPNLRPADPSYIGMGSEVPPNMYGQDPRIIGAGSEVPPNLRPADPVVVSVVGDPRPESIPAPGGDGRLIAEGSAPSGGWTDAQRVRFDLLSQGIINRDLGILNLGALHSYAWYRPATVAQVAEWVLMSPVDVAAMFKMHSLPELPGASVALPSTMIPTAPAFDQAKALQALRDRVGLNTPKAPASTVQPPSIGPSIGPNVTATGDPRVSVAATGTDIEAQFMATGQGGPAPNMREGAPQVMPSRSGALDSIDKPSLSSSLMLAGAAVVAFLLMSK